MNLDLVNACYVLGMAHIKVTEYQNVSSEFKKAIAL